MDNGKRKVVMAQMKPRERHEWTAKTPHRRRFKWDKRLLRRSVPLAAVFLCIGRRYNSAFRQRRPGRYEPCDGGF